MEPSSAQEKYYALPVAFASGPESKSFEEVRIEDYLAAYMSTGRPPAPYPLIPPTPQQQQMLKIPPPFEPHSIPATVAKEVPAIQVWSATKAGNEDFYSITCENPYSLYSFEELRIRAYIAGNKTPPPHLTLVPFGVSAVASAAKPSTPVMSASPATEQLESLSTQPAYSNHSLEELRFAFWKAGRQLTSEEITRGVGPTPVPFGGTALGSGASALSGSGPFAPSVGGAGSPFAPTSSAPFPPTSSAFTAFR
ncbi:hypothetical protein C8J56DRAFT_932937 [Mycena floridula]|nr:hypothetical protein C8J56DRAFT_932937 [Mycena floridula]